MQPDRKQRTLICSALLLGILLGALLIFWLKPNQIYFQVRDTGKLYLYVNKGDVIHWSGDPSNMTVSFLPPKNFCREDVNSAHLNTCTVRQLPPSGSIYKYACDSGTPCDPGVGGPGSVTGGFVPDVYQFFIRLFGFGYGSAIAVPGLPQTALSDPTAPQMPDVRCDANRKTTVDPITDIAPGAVIEWESDQVPIDKWTVVIDDPNTCVGGRTQFPGSGGGCHVATPATYPQARTYTATASGCTSVKATFNVIKYP